MTYARREGVPRGRFVRWFSHLQLGDVVLVDWNGPAPGAFFHSMVVTRIVGVPGQPNFDLLLTYHTNNRLDKSLKALRADPANEGATWWGFHLFNSY